MEPDKLEAEQLELIPLKKTALHLVSTDGERQDDDFSEIRGKFLSRPQFLNLLRIEKRRSDRSKSPLSVILFSMGYKPEDDGKHLDRFFNYIHGVTRETDIKGLISEDIVGLILPDTDRDGSQACIRKIIQGNGQFPYSVVSATYPDALFQKLLNDAENQPDLFPLNLDQVIIYHGFELFLKRVLDVIGSLFGLILFSPLYFIISLAVKINSPGPIIFRQVRLGKGGEKFSFMKFRSMYANNDDQIHRDYVTNLIKGNLNKINQGSEIKPVFKMKKDHRVTKVGKIIRKLSLDELPQFWNVLRGEMSLVGPRPPISYEIEKYEPWHLRRVLEMKPGITGLWQVEGRNTTTFNEMVRLDLRYVRDWSIWLDIKILVKTVVEVFRPSGAA
jgi:lipopolysaccharide/colanic/teichoic acid biosynthesis glycosyltransferase